MNEISTTRGLDFAQVALAMARASLARRSTDARFGPPDAAAQAEMLWGPHSDMVKIVRGVHGMSNVTKANEVPGGSTASGSWGAELYSYQQAANEFFDLVFENTIIGKLSNLRRTPLAIRTIGATAGLTAYWIGESRPVPCSRMTFDRQSLAPRKVAALTVVSQELARSSIPQAIGVIRNDLLRAIAGALDLAFIDPDNDGVADEMPGSVTNGVTPIASTGDPAADFAAVIEDFEGDLSSASWVCNPNTATRIALFRSTGGDFLFPDCGPRGGSILGIPLICSRSVPGGGSSGDTLALIDGSGIAYGEAGGEIRASDNASIEMNSAPAGDSETPTGSTQTLVSMFQCDATAILATRVANWRMVRPGSVSVLSLIDYAP